MAGANIYRQTFANNTSDKQYLAIWEDFLSGIFRATTAPKWQSMAEKAEFKKKIEKPGNEEEWMAYIFPNYYKCKAAAFQKRSTRRLMGKKRYRQARRWARGLAKSVRRMMELFYKHFVEGYRLNMLMISKTEDNAARLLEPYRANLEANQRLIDLYGEQVKHGNWGRYEFQTRKAANFRAVGCEQNPRGARLEELRITCIVFDDADDDEVCNNKDRLDKRWDWIERAVLPTIDVAGDYLIFFDNNPIDEDCLVNRFAAFVDDNEIVPMEYDNGESAWSEKNSLEDIALIKKSMSDAAYQTEYRCNPIRAGKTFAPLTWGKCPPLQKLQFAVIYNDPAPSNNDKPSLKSNAIGSAKGSGVIGYLNGKYYVYKVFNDHANTDTFITWMYNQNDYVAPHTTAMQIIENNTLQDPHWEQVIKPGIHKKAKELNRGAISIITDDRKKPDKFFRIEGTLQPLVRDGELVFNEEEKDSPHMKRTAEQFKSASPNSKELCGPDFIEGGVWIIQNKISVVVDLYTAVKVVPRPINKKRM